MWSPVSCCIANLVMEDIEERALSSLLIYRGFGKDGDGVICTVLKNNNNYNKYNPLPIIWSHFQMESNN